MDKKDIVVYILIILCGSLLFALSILENNNVKLTNQNDDLMYNYDNLRTDWQGEKIDNYELRTAISNLETKEINYKSNITELEGNISDSNQEIKNMKIDIAQKDYLLNRYIERGAILKNPTYKEVKQFLRDDETKYNYYSYEYDCTEFAFEMISNAKAKGIYASPVEITYLQDWGHIIVAFNTSDRGIVYVEPQYGTVVELEIKEGYWNHQIDKISSYFEVIVK